jgi:hypothetical protein
VFFLDPARRIYGIPWSPSGSAELRSEKHFRAVNVQWIGQWAFLALVAFSRINKLRVINTLNRSTPAATATAISKLSQVI